MSQKWGKAWRVIQGLTKPTHPLRPADGHPKGVISKFNVYMNFISLLLDNPKINKFRSIVESW
jgi:hypothetical protein